VTRDRVAQLLERSEPQPQALIGDLMAIYWPDSGDSIASAALVGLLADFGFSAASSRTALSRLARRGRIARTRSGRSTSYRQTEAGASRVGEVRRRVLAFGPEPEPWDGRWRMVAFNIPESRRGPRHLLRERLREIGLRPLCDAVWISPRGSANALTTLLEESGIERATVFEAALASPIDVAALFDVGELRSRYRAFMDDFAPFAGDRQLGPRDALIVRTIAWDRWREIVQADGALPAELLGGGWPRAAAHTTFTELHRLLEPRARKHVVGTVKRFG